MKRYHFIGIGGVSMSALAKLLVKQGYYVQGSDLNVVHLPDIKTFVGHNENNVKNVDIVVYSNAIEGSNEELIYARKNKIKTMSRGELLGEIAKRYKNVIAISGMHGKTTTTEMLAEIFDFEGKEPTVLLGGISNLFKSNLKIGKNKYIILEACEYKDAFLNLKPKVGAILNIEKEHLDYFKNLENIKKSFYKFEKNCKACVKLEKRGKDIYCKCGKKIYTAKNIKEFDLGKYEFDLFENNIFLTKIRLGAYGKHNVNNALVAIAISMYFKLSIQKIAFALKNYTGVKRRFEMIKKEPLIIHDYAHHPTEIKKVIELARRVNKGNLYVVFQPHTYSRTLSLKKSFVKVLSNVKKVYIVKSYSAREKFVYKGSAKALSEALINSYYYSNIDKLYNKLKKHLKQEDTLLILGAGDINNLFEMFLN